MQAFTLTAAQRIKIAEQLTKTSIVSTFVTSGLYFTAQSYDGRTWTVYPDRAVRN